MSAAVRLTIAMESAAALAAHLRVNAEGLDIDRQVRSLLDEIASELVEEPTDDGPAAQSIVGMVRAFMRQSTELVENPGRVGDWDHVDEAILQGVGRLSMAIVDAFQRATETLGGLDLSRPGARFLDVGTGTGWLAIATARRFPSLQVTGIDIFEPALQLARRNVAAEGMSERVALTTLNAIDLDGSETYDAIWLPLPFMPKDIVPQAMAAAVRALRPGGWLLPGTFAGPGDRLSQLLIDLRTVRSGGHPWQPEDLVALLGAHGLADAQEIPRTWAAPVRLYAGRRADPQ
jgi:SAM-dependent methyltransferase